LANVEEDNWEWHTFDTIKGGDYLVDQDAAEVMAKEAIDAVLDLEKMGLPFNRTPEGKIDQRRFGGHTRDHGKAPVRRADGKKVVAGVVSYELATGEIHV
ncbi:FAD-binding protein, partial [Brevibacterium paucivorans]